MQTIRLNTFETNSSSTHAMIIAMESDFEKWEKGEVYYAEDNNIDGRHFITKEEALTIVQKKCPGMTIEELDEVFNNDPYEYYIWTYDAYCNDRFECLECCEDTYTTPNGEKVRVLCHYGYDG